MMRTTQSRTVTWLLCAGVACAGLTPAHAVRERKAEEQETVSADEYQAIQMVRKADDLHKAGSYEQAQKMLENVVDKWPASRIRYKVWLMMGKHAMDRHQWADAISALKKVEGLHREDEGELKGENLETYLEALYLTGVAYYESSQYATAFPILRRITVQYPNTMWANQSYYYIGMCHFAMKNWSRAIQNLSMVGTLIDPDSPSAEYVESGRRFYVKIQDGDLPILHRLGKEISIEVATKNGDKEKVVCTPLSSTADEYIGSIGTDVSLPKPGDGRLQIWGHDEITSTYYDENTQNGEFRVPRTSKTQVLCSGGVSFTVATYDRKADLAYQDDNVYVAVFDSDLDTSPQAETASVRLVSRYRKPEGVIEQPPDAQVVGVDVEKVLKAEEESKYAVRDEVTVALNEVNADGTRPATGQSVHSGLFVGMVPVKAAGRDDVGDIGDNALSCYVDDEIIATYTDARHFDGEAPRDVTASIRVVGKLTKVPTARQSFIADPEKRARKCNVEATAYLELAKIFRDMGLKEGASQKCDTGLELVAQVIGEQSDIPRRLKEEAFKLKWELALTKDDLELALATCDVFAKLFPESEFVDQAMMRIAQVHAEKKNYADAIRVFNSVLALPGTQMAAEALFRIAELKENIAMATGATDSALTSGEALQVKALSAGLPDYRRCAEEYPDSRFAGEALAKMVDYYVMAKDYAAAEDLLDQVYLDYPDAEFIPRMLLKWVLVAARRGNNVRAKQKCQELLFEHPQTVYAKKAAELLTTLEGRTQEAQDAQNDKASGEGTGGDNE